MSSIKLSLAAVLISLTASFCQPAFSAGSAENSFSPEDLYHQAWSLVRDRYYDAKFAGKDWSSWEHKYDGQLATVEDAQKAISFMLGQLGDPYTRFLSADEFRKEKSLMTGSDLVGVGILLERSKDKAHIYVTDTIEGSPARRAGITSGDELLAIDSVPVNSITPDQCGQKISGQENTTVALRFKNTSGERNIEVKREHFVINPVSAKELEGNIGYIKLSSFLYSDATQEFKQALLKMADKDGLIVDLRHNPGGQTFNALEIADMLLDHGVIVRTIDRRGSAADTALGRQLTKQPMVVLVDHDSASASEILAAALKDHKRAEIVGTRTFGKGLVQEIEPLMGGTAMHLTVAQFMSPNGTQINHVGVNPEVEVSTSPEEQMKVAVSELKNRIASSTQGRRVAGRADLARKRS